MRIAIASSGLGHVARGIESWAADLGRALARRGVAVDLYKGGGTAKAEYEHVVSCWERASARTRRLDGWLPRQGRWRIGLGSAYEIEQATFAIGLLRRLRHRPADILHVQDPSLALLAQRASKFGWIGARTILGHGTEESPGFLDRIDFVQHLAPDHLEEARAAGSWKPSWTAIPNFIDTNRFRPGRNSGLRAELGIPGDGLVVLTVAAIRRVHKRVDHLLEEFARLVGPANHRDAWLVVAGGREPETEELVDSGRALLGDRVRFLVDFPRLRMPELYGAADVFVLCSRKEMLPIALLEAGACGLPCLAGPHPVLRWVVGPGIDPVDMEAPGALAASLGDLLGDGTRRRHLGELARRHSMDNFGEERVVGKLLDYYRFVMSTDDVGPDRRRPDRRRPGGEPHGPPGALAKGHPARAASRARSFDSIEEPRIDGNEPDRPRRRDFPPPDLASGATS